MTNKSTKRCLTSSAMTETQSKTIMRYHHTHISMVKIKRVIILNTGRDSEKLHHLDITEENLRCNSHSGQQSDSFL